MVLRFFIALSSVFVTGCLVPLEHETRNMSIPHVSMKPLVVEAVNGKISVHQHEGTEIELQANVGALSQERLKATQVIVERDEEGKLTVRVEWPDGRRLNNEGCGFDIAIPDTSQIDLKSSNGNIELTGLSGDAKVRTSNGKITTEDFAGNLDAKTSNGSIRSNGVSGTQKLVTSNGSVKVKEALNKTEISSSNGSVDFGLAVGATGPFDISTSNGSVDLELNTDFQGKLNLQTSNASIKNETNAKVLDNGKKRKVLQFGESDIESKVKTSNGKIEVEIDDDD